MKYILLLLATTHFALFITAQDCGVFITTDFDSECLITTYIRKPELLHDESFCFHACQGSTVTYYANGMSNADFEWNVQGADNWYVLPQYDAVVVLWPTDGQFGNVSVTATNTITQQVCTFNRCIEIIDKPIAGITTFPTAESTGVNMVLNICLGQTVHFNDNSFGSASAPIVGYKWEWDQWAYDPAFTPNIEMTFNQVGTYTLVHTVINECGCEDSKIIEINVQQSPAIQFTCYGTACGGDIVTYELVNPDCTQYIYEVENGMVVNFDFPFVTIQWENPASGYGILRLDGNFCNNICDENSYIVVPIITNNVEINGPVNVCTGDLALYELPLWGATSYFWSVDGPFPQSVEIIPYLTPNQRFYHFPIAGEYQIYANYWNTVLPDCGYMTGSPLTVYVSEKIEIEAESNACRNEIVEFITNPQDFVDWFIIDEFGDTLHTENSNLLSFSFDVAGNYSIIASNSDYCNNAISYINIMESPPPPEVENISGLQAVCPNSTALYSAQASSPLFYINWISQYTSPASFSGEEFSAMFGATVGDIGVFHTDRISGCNSDTVWYEVEEFVPQEIVWDIPDEVCANTYFEASVELENQILYQWNIIPATAASIADIPFGNENTIQVNNIPDGNFTVRVTRKYCNTQDINDTIIDVVSTPVPILDLPEDLCENDYLVLNLDNALDFNSNDQLVWTINGSIVNNTVGDLPVNVLIDFSGEFFVELQVNPVNNCPSVAIGQWLYAVAAPVAYVYQYDYNNDVALTVTVQDNNVDYEWSTTETTPTIIVTNQDTYYCTVTNQHGCTSVVSITVPSDGEPSGNVTGFLNLTQTYNDCGDYQWEASGYITGPVQWNIYPSAGVNTSVSGNDDQIVDVTFAYPGLYTIFASAPDGGTGVYRKSDTIAVPLLPDFEILFACDQNNQDNIIISIDNLTSYLDGVVIIDSEWSVNGTPVTTNISVETDETYTVLLTVEFTYEHPVTGVNFDATCSISQQIYLEPRAVADFSVTGFPNFCSGTPVNFINNSTGNILNYFWELSPQVSLITENAVTNYSVSENTFFTTSLTVTDRYTCTSKKTIQINVRPNTLSGTLEATGTMVCAGSPREIEYTLDGEPLGLPVYIWMPHNDTTIVNTYDVYSTGDYYLLLEDEYGCLEQSGWLNVGFHNTPVAAVHGLTAYCYDEEIALFGDIGNIFDYHWDITSPSSQTDDVYTPNLYYMPNESGVWDIIFTVSIDYGQTTCYDEENLQIIIHGADAPPDIAFTHPPCLIDDNVYVHSNSGSVYWSNGTIDQNAQYYSSGFLTAYTINDTTGCKSVFSELFIPPAPNFDALATGCYKRCPDWFSQLLPTFISPIGASWAWVYEGDTIQSGHSIDTFLILPDNPPGYGDYFLNISYSNDNCYASSPLLTLEEEDLCVFDSLGIRIPVITCFVDSCFLYYSVSVSVSNTSDQVINILDIIHPSAYDVIALSPASIPAQTVDDLEFTFSYFHHSLQILEFTLILEQNNVTYTFPIEIDLNEVVNPQDCFNSNCSASLDDIDIFLSGSTYAYYFEISFNQGLPYVLVNTSVGTVFGYNYDPNTGLVTGYFGFSDVFYNNYCAESDPEDICLEIAACINDEICITEICFNQQDLCNTGNKSLSDNWKDYETAIDILENKPVEFYLVPNPAFDFVELIGIENSLIQPLMLFDLNGKLIKTSNKSGIDVSELAPGTYILRFTKDNGQIETLKLIKL